MTEEMCFELDICCKEFLLNMKATVGLSVALFEWDNMQGALMFVFLLNVLIGISTTEETYPEQRSVSVFEVFVTRRFYFVSKRVSSNGYCPNK